REALDVLEGALLTADLPQDGRVELAARYRPASTDHRVGGDWFDALRRPGGRTLLVVGDVAGHDPTAAAAMGQLRAVLRTLAVDRLEDPAHTVRRLETTAAALGLDVTATCLVAELSSGPGACPGALLRWTSAGHLPPLLLHPGGRAELLTTAPELLLGVRPDAARSDHEVRLAPGSTLLLYTDGLVERRDHDLDEGLELLRRTATGLAGRPLPALLDGLLTGLAAALGDPRPPHPAPGADDVVLLAARLHPVAA
ncbi:PP2C family protein-serine/threonine phosphatase, partial [Kineococcus glutinatus]|uniref:PP2C family protein-serine/threonine phosphatase n=1 Tax=Kineococcus glutinatus TaxID=1070872 RepID=UPI0031E7DB27